MGLKHEELKDITHPLTKKTIRKIITTEIKTRPIFQDGSKFRFKSEWLSRLEWECVFQILTTYARPEYKGRTFCETDEAGKWTGYEIPTKRGTKIFKKMLSEKDPKNAFEIFTGRNIP